MLHSLACEGGFEKVGSIRPPRRGLDGLHVPEIGPSLYMLFALSSLVQSLYVLQNAAWGQPWLLDSRTGGRGQATSADGGGRTAH